MSDNVLTLEDVGKALIGIAMAAVGITLLVWARWAR